jgi:hypothetical protein
MKWLGYAGYHPTELSTPQNNRLRAAAFSRRCRSRSLRYSSNAARSASVTEAWVGTTHAVGQRVTPLVRMYSAMTVSQLSSEITSIDVSLRIEKTRGISVGSPNSDIRHCSQAEANDAAAAQIAAQTPSEVNKTSIQNTSLARTQAASYPDLSGCSGQRNSQW